ncbi:MAG: carboxypeptidase-like regulatory domain-containing protein [Owenweeksia sp.]|nr:carboxypeptidase-like regulatory domain-containing protein [Owenweeksia sp.]
MYRHFIFYILLLASLTGHTQKLIQGTIVNKDGEPLAGANVYLRGTYDGGSTNAEGKFSFKTSLEGAQVVVVSMLGFQTKEVPVICEDAEILLKEILRETINTLAAVEITAGSMKASDENRSVIFKPLDIVTTAGALGDIVGALNTLPGTAVNGADGRLFVRGGDARETAIFFDGLKSQQRLREQPPGCSYPYEV